MAVGKCEQCGVEEYMPFVCKFCRGRYCVSHRLPENHACAGLDNYRERLRAEGRVMAPEPDVLRPRVSAGSRLGASVGGVFDKMRGRVAYTLLGIMAGVFLLQSILQVAGLFALEDYLFFLDRTFYLKPWVLVTSVFAHAGLGHLFFNGLFLFLFGPTLERLLGPRRFAYLFLGAGVLAGLVQLVVFNFIIADAVPSLAWIRNANILGASGALLAMLGTLAYLAPKLTVLLMFIIPAPLWAITALVAFVNVLGLLQPGKGIATLAHLAGLGVGLYYGKRLKDQGMRVQVPNQPMPRRPF